MDQIISVKVSTSGLEKNKPVDCPSKVKFILDAQKLKRIKVMHRKLMARAKAKDFLQVIRDRSKSAVWYQSASLLSGPVNSETIQIQMSESNIVVVGTGIYFMGRTLESGERVCTNLIPFASIGLNLTAK